MSSASSLPSTHSEWRRTGQTNGVEGGLELKKDVAVPTPKRGQVLVKVHAVSLNFRDLIILKGQYPLPSLLKTGVPASDAAGEVVAVGEGVTAWKVGARVAPTFFPSFIGGTQRNYDKTNTALGGDAEGVLAQYIVADEKSLVDIGSLSYEEAAALPCAGVTAWNALYNGVQPLKAGRTVLVQGTGGVSVLAAQIAIAAGARVIATSSSDEKLARMEKLGVAKGDLINYKKTPEWGKKVLELTDGKGVDHVIEVGGPGTAAQSIESIRVGGEVSVIGMVGGGEGSINPLTLLFKGATMRGILVGNREDFRDLLDSIHQNKIKPVIDSKTFTFDKASDAFKHLESGSHFGKVIIKVV